MSDSKREDARLQALAKLEHMMNELGFTFGSTISSNQDYYKIYNIKSAQFCIIINFTNSPEKKSYRPNVSNKIKSVQYMWNVDDEASTITVNDSSTMEEFENLPPECLNDISTLMVKTNSHKPFNHKECYVVTRKCMSCKNTVKSFIESSKGSTCLNCL